MRPYVLRVVNLQLFWQKLLHKDIPTQLEGVVENENTFIWHTCRALYHRLTWGALFWSIFLISIFLSLRLSFTYFHFNLKGRLTFKFNSSSHLNNMFRNVSLKGAFTLLALTLFLPPKNNLILAKTKASLKQNVHNNYHLGIIGNMNSRAALKQ